MWEDDEGDRVYEGPIGRPRRAQPYREANNSDSDDDAQHNFNQPERRREERGGAFDDRNPLIGDFRGGLGPLWNRGVARGQGDGFGMRPNDRRDNRGRGRGGTRGGIRIEGGPRRGDRGDRTKRKLDARYLRELRDREDSDVAMTLAHPQSGFRDCLKEAALKSDLLPLLLHVLAKAFRCNSVPENLNTMFIIMKETNFFNTAVEYFLDLQAVEAVTSPEACREPISDMITIMEELVEKNPTCITEFVGIHTVLEGVIDELRQSSTVINADILKRFQEFTEQKNRKLKRQQKRKQAPPTQDDIERQQDIDGPPGDFRDIEIFPQTADMQVTGDLYLRKNKLKGNYDDLEHYLDVQFRLMREDFVSPLREGISEYIQATMTMGQKGKKKKSQDIRIYNNVHVISAHCADVGICHILQFDVSRLQHVRWQSSKRLIYGSLLCLSHDNFQTINFATVSQKNPEEVQKGLINVRFEMSHDVTVELWDKTFTMAETTAYFESYRHVLLGLQKIRNGDLPFEKYILKCDNKVQAPAYISRNRAAEIDLRPLVDEDFVLKDDRRLENIDDGIDEQIQQTFSRRSKEANHVTILERETWPPADLLHLDRSQYEAIHTALTNEFVITQGPPGTGKTYIGLKIVKALLHNKDLWSVDSATGERDPRPMLVVCYTNHALDQFLEGIVQFYKGDLIRIGSRSQSEILKPYNLHNFRQRFRHDKHVPVQIFQARREARNEMESLLGKINAIAAKIQVAQTQVLHEDFLRDFMGHEVYERLTGQFEELLQVYPEAREALQRRYSVVVEWLELGNLAPIVEMEGNIPAEMLQNAPNQAPGQAAEQEHDLIEVEYEVDAIQEERQIDMGDDSDGEDFFDIPITRKEANEIKIKQALHDQMKAVALNVESLGNKPRNMTEFDWQYQRKERRKLRVKTQKNLASNDIMTKEEALRIGDLWRLKVADKWKLYRLWRKTYCDSLRKDILENEQEYETAAARHKEALMHEDKEIMRHSTVIGMTTTGAARYQPVLQEIKPRIIIVEEAAEVLEAHIVATLSRGCEHLILIGDHKQLRPSPTVYNLAKDYNLDVSLFERMVTNGLRCDTLELQHRMRPQIAELMKHIYTGLRDHISVQGYEDIKGISTNIFFVDHRHQETEDEDLKSHSNMHEAEYIVALCKYLLLQGYKPNQITVLTMYSGQLFCLKNLMPKDEFEGVRVTVVDNFQGEENDILLLSLVRSNEEENIGFLKTENRICVSLSRAKKGLYVIGNFDLLASQSNLWKEIVIDMTQKGLLGEGLLLHCQNHPDSDGIIAREPNDFKKAPEGGCNRKCEYRLKCGHVCNMFCHIIDQEHADYECKKTCNRYVCQNNHKCKRKCYQECGECEEIVEKTLPKCGHKTFVPCGLDAVAYVCQERCSKTLECGHRCESRCGNACTANCTILVEKKWPCGHSGSVNCHEKDTGPCPEPCGMVLECQHICSGTCGSCFEGRLHRVCKNKCSRILVCGHECPNDCNFCPPCTKRCENRCTHSKCSKRCGEPCSPCMELCDWRCPHYKCTQLCHEPCNRPRCNEPCTKRLPCGHQCIGLCGETCPNDCRECDKDKVTEILFGHEDEQDARFVMLEDCHTRCIIEQRAMDYYMDEKVENGQIQLKTCPKCKTPIRRNKRYGTIINQSLIEIEKVKTTILSSRERIRDLEDDIEVAVIEEPNDTKQLMKRRLRLMESPKSEHALAAMKNQLTFLKSIRILIDDWNKLKGIAVDAERIKGLFNLDRLFAWALEERTIMTQQETSDAEMEIARSRDLLRILMYQKQLAERHKTIDAGFRNRVREAERLLNLLGKYDEDRKAIVHGTLEELNSLLGGLGISEDERLMIVQAMALPKGHWYQCPEGHVYAIGDCGGANSIGRCPECNSEIGGMAHHLRPGNVHTGIMDDSEHAAWSDAANLAAGFDIQFED